MFETYRHQQWRQYGNMLTCSRVRLPRLSMPQPKAGMVRLE